MTCFSWFGYEVEADETATAAWYAQAEDWGCACGHCRNFLALARERRLPEEILAILDSLRIPPEKATYVLSCTTTKPGRKRDCSISSPGGWRAR